MILQRFENIKKKYKKLKIVYNSQKISDIFIAMEALIQRLII